MNSFRSKKTLTVGSKTYTYFSIPDAAQNGLGDFRKLPYSLKVLLENLLRNENGRSVKKEDIQAIVAWLKDKRSTHEIAYHPARVLMQDFTGVPAVVDLAAMRDAMKTLGGDPQKINPLSPVDLVIDHSVDVDHFGSNKAFDLNMAIEFDRNQERYEFLKWGQGAFQNFRVVPPGTGICHQVNVEYLAQVVWSKKDGTETVVYPDTCVGTDSHTTMVNGLAVLGWGVGGIEAEAAMLGQPVSMLIPEVVGFRLQGKLSEGVTATDLVLTVTQMLRKLGVVGKFVEFYGPGLDELTLADRCTLANMAPEYGATCGFFPIDQETINYLKLTARPQETIALVEAYAKAQGMWREANSPDPEFTTTLSLDLSTVVPSLAGPKRPQDRVALAEASASFQMALPSLRPAGDTANEASVKGKDFALHNGDVVIAAITSCTNTSNPSVLIAAGLVAKKARALGLQSKPWVKTSLAPGSQVVTEYLTQSGLQHDLDALGFQTVGYGCTTCIGNSGPLPEEIAQAVTDKHLVVCSVLSGNRNFEGRVNPHVRANYLASPPLVVAYALAGTFNIDITKDPIGNSKNGKPVYLKDVWPTTAEVKSVIASAVSPEMFAKKYADVFKGPSAWQKIPTGGGLTYSWSEKSTYIKHPPYFENMSRSASGVSDVVNARPLALLGDSITTDHISPAGSIKADSPAGKYLQERGIEKKNFNSYGSRRGNHEVMMRGTFANIRIRNEMAPGTEGGVTKYVGQGAENGKVMPIYDAAMLYQKEKTPLVVIAGKEYGTGSSRDWAAKGTVLLGVRAVIAESFERIHRSNLIGMGVLPFQFAEGVTRQTLGLDGSETFHIRGVAGIQPQSNVAVEIVRANGQKQTVAVKCRIDTVDELEYYKNSGILHYVLRNLA